MATRDSSSRVSIVLTITTVLALLGGVYYRAAHPGDVLITIGAEDTTPQEGSPITLKVCARSRDSGGVRQGTLARLIAGASGRFVVPTAADFEAAGADAQQKAKDEARDKALEEGSPTVFIDVSSETGSGSDPKPRCQSVWFKAEASGPVEIVASTDGGEAKLMLAVIPDDGEGVSNSAGSSHGGASSSASYGGSSN